jgi:hypothetical protein
MNMGVMFNVSFIPIFTFPALTLTESNINTFSVLFAYKCVLIVEFQEPCEDWRLHIIRSEH